MKQTSIVFVILAAVGFGVALGLNPRGEPVETSPEPAPRPTPAAYRPVGLEDSAHPTGPSSAPPAKPKQSPRMVGPDGTPIERAG